MISGAPRPLPLSMDDQIKYLLKHTETTADHLQYKHLLMLNNELLKALENPHLAHREEYLGVPFSYWKKDYERNVENQFKTLQQPILVIQGEKDYQVTIEDFEIWKNWAQEISAENFSFLLIPQMNHILNITKNEYSLPKEYLLKGVPAQSLSDEITQWILNN